MPRTPAAIKIRACRVGQSHVAGAICTVSKRRAAGLAVAGERGCVCVAQTAQSLPNRPDVLRRSSARGDLENRGD
jgi:hypothetical protein